MSDHRNLIDAEIGARIRQRRNEIAMTQQQLGQATGVTFQQIQKYEKGANAVSAARLLDVARALGCEVAWFYGALAGEGARPGFADDGGPGYDAPPPPGPEGRQLAHAFRRIRDPRVRKRVVDLVDSLASEAEDGAGGAKRSL